MSKKYWHFLPEDRRLRYGRRMLVKPGKTFRIKAQPIICSRGFHACERAIDALRYAPGPIICRVTLGGTILSDTDQAVAQSRRVLWMADATNTLHEFACWCAENALRTANVQDVRCWQAIETKRKWLRGEATDEELVAARAAAWAVRDARDAARAAARVAARAAGAAAGAAWAAWVAGDAARAAGAAAGAAWAAGDAAGDAARDAHNTRLEELLAALEMGGLPANHG